MVTDPTGEAFGSLKITGSYPGSAFLESDNILWNPGEELPVGFYNIVYSVKIDEEALDFDTTNGVFSDMPLNGDTTLKYTYGGTAYEVAFPLPTADFKMGRLVVVCRSESDASNDIITYYDYIVTDHGDAAFDYTPPQTIAVKNGTYTLTDAGNTYTKSGGNTVNYTLGTTPLDATAGDNTLILTYSYTDTTTYAVTATAGTGGTAASDVAYVASGEDANISITPALGYMINKVTVNSTEVTPTYTVSDGVYSFTLENITQAQSVAVTFKAAEQYTVTLVSADTDQGTVSPASSTVYSGNSAFFTLSPAANYRYSGYTLTDTASGLASTDASVTVNGNGLAVSGIRGNVTVTVAWESSLPSYTVSYDGSNAESGTAPDGTTCVSGSQYTVLGGGTLAKENCVFNGWTYTDSLGVAHTVKTDDVITVTENITLSSLWQDHFTATVNLLLDDAAWANSGKAFALYNDDEKIADMAEGNNDGIYTASVTVGTYSVRSGTAAVGSVDVTNRGGSTTVDYYTVSAAITGQDTTKNDTVTLGTADWDGSDTFVLKGTTISVSASTDPTYYPGRYISAFTDPDGTDAGVISAADEQRVINVKTEYTIAFAAEALTLDTSRPEDYKTSENTNAYFSVRLAAGITAVGPLTYSWQLGIKDTETGEITWTTITTETAFTTASIILENVQLTDSGEYYRCIVTDSVTKLSATSVAALLTVNPALAVTLTPSTQTISLGSSATLTAALTEGAGTAPFEYTWQYWNTAANDGAGGWADIQADADAATLSVSPTTTTKYRVQVEDALDMIASSEMAVVIVR